MDEREFIQHWSYYCSLVERLDETKHFINHGLKEEKGEYCLIHKNVYSDVFKQIILLAASEFEIMCKALCAFHGSKPKTIVGISKKILSEYPLIVKSEIGTPFCGIKPVEGWRVEGEEVLGLSWWKAYNSIKHGKKDSSMLATLENAIMSVGALYIINLYLMYKVNGNLSVAYSYPSVYFRSKYTAHAVSGGEGLLPDFGDMSPMERIQEKYPQIFKKELADNTK